MLFICTSNDCAGARACCKCNLLSRPALSVTLRATQRTVPCVVLSLGQRFAPGVVDRVGNYLAVLVDDEEGRAENARAVEDLADFDGYVALQVFARLAAFCAGCIVEFRAQSSSACVVYVPCRIAPVLGYEYIAVGYREVVDDIMPRYRLPVVLHLSS